MAAQVQSKLASGSSTAPSVTFNAAPTQNNLLIAFVFSASSTAITMTSSGWTALTSAAGGSGSSQRAARIFFKIAGASESSTVTAASGSNNWTIVVAEYSGMKTTSVLNIDNSQINASGTTNTPTVTPTTGTDVLIVAGIGIRGAGTASSQQINASTTGVNPRQSTNATNSSVDFFDKFVTAPSGNYQASDTFSASAVGAGAIAVFYQGKPSFTKTHTTDALKRTATTKSHTADAFKRATTYTIADFESGTDGFTSTTQDTTTGADGTTKSGKATNDANNDVQPRKTIVGPGTHLTQLVLWVKLPAANVIVSGDASAVLFDQGGSWKWTSLYNWVDRASTAWQKVTIPLSKFTANGDSTPSTAGTGTAYDPDQASDFGFRFWNDTSRTWFYDQIVMTMSTPSATKTHTTDAFKRGQITKTHTTDANKKVSGVTKTHTTDANKKVSGSTKTHTSDALKRGQYTKAHTTDSRIETELNSDYWAVAFTPSASTYTATHTTDALRRKSATATHTTDALKLKAYTPSHTSDALKRRAYTSYHATDILKRKSFSLAHTVDTLKRKALSITHTTDTLKKKQSTYSHTTDALKQGSSARSHSTDANKRKSITGTHTTDTLKRKALTLSHTIDSLKRKSATLTHTTDLVKRGAYTRSHTTAAFKLKAYTKAHSVDALRRLINSHSHTTDTLKRKSSTYTHTSDALVESELKTDAWSIVFAPAATVFHTTDALKRKVNAISHTTDTKKYIPFNPNPLNRYLLQEDRSYLLQQNRSGILIQFPTQTQVHATDALKRKQTSIVHTTNALKRTETETAHTTDANKTPSASISHTTDTFAYTVGKPVWVSPINHASGVAGGEPLVFVIPKSTKPIHFHLQIDTANTFDTGSLMEYKSWINQTGWEYYNGSSWVPVPFDGVDPVYAGNQGRFVEVFADGTYYRRIRGRII